jgi:hypothetical protein
MIMKKFFIIFLIHFLFFLVLTFYFNHESGGDIGIALFGIISFLLYSIICGLISLKRDSKFKLYLVITLLITAVIEILFFRIIVLLSIT